MATTVFQTATDAKRDARIAAVAVAAQRCPAKPAPYAQDPREALE